LCAAGNGALGFFIRKSTLKQHKHGNNTSSHGKKKVVTVGNITSDNEDEISRNIWN
jgi:hypothetical protein